MSEFTIRVPEASGWVKLGPIGREVVENYFTTRPTFRVVHLWFFRTGSSRKLYSLQLDPEYIRGYLVFFRTGSSRIFGSELYSRDFRSGPGLGRVWAGFGPVLWGRGR